MTYSIGEAAAKTNLSTYTLRYYDKEGLLPMVERRSNGIRIFDDSDIGWVNLIKCLKASGLSIKEIRQYIDWYLQGDSTLEARRKLFYQRRKAIEKEIAALQKTLDAINYKCWFYDTAVQAGTIEAPQQITVDQMPPKVQDMFRKSGLSHN